MAQVKFYSVSSLPNDPNGGGVYFVDGGELYKGAQRFGANKVWTTKPAEIAGVIGGDLYISGGVTEVFNGSTWVSIVDISGLDLSLKASIGDSSTTESHGISAAVTLHSNAEPSLAMTVGAITTAADITSTSDFFTTGSAIWNLTNGLSAGTSGTSYIESIGYDENGKLVANAKAFPALATGTTDGTIKLGDGSDVKVSGWDALVSDKDDLESRVSAIEEIVDASQSIVTANTGTFTSLTVGDKTVSEIAGVQIAASTLSGNIAASDGTSLVNEGQVVNYVSAQLQSFDNAMHFVGTTSDELLVQDYTGLPTGINGKTSAADLEAGDIVLKGTEEYIWTGSKWEKIGDQSAVTGGTSTSTLNNVSVEVVTAAATAAPSVTLTGVGTAASKNFADTIASTGTSLPTESAVAGYVADVIGSLAGSASAADKGVSVEVVTADGEVSTVGVSVTAASTMAFGATGSADELATTAAVKSFYDNNLVWLGANDQPLT